MLLSRVLGSVMGQFLGLIVLFVFFVREALILLAALYESLRSSGKIYGVLAVL